MILKKQKRKLRKLDVIYLYVTKDKYETVIDWDENKYELGIRTGYSVDAINKAVSRAYHGDLTNFRRVILDDQD